MALSPFAASDIAVTVAPAKVEVSAWRGLLLSFVPLVSSKFLSLYRQIRLHCEYRHCTSREGKKSSTEIFEFLKCVKKHDGESKYLKIDNLMLETKYSDEAEWKRKFIETKMHIIHHHFSFFIAGNNFCYSLMDLISMSI